MSNVFISYRRSDAAGHAGRLFDRLLRQFGDRAVFFDRESIQEGELFTERIAEAIHASQVVLALANHCMGGCHAVLHGLVEAGIELDPDMAGLYEQLNAAVGSPAP